MADHNVAHGSFTLQRVYPADITRVFAAFGTLEGKDNWFGKVGDMTMIERSFDFRVGGREVAKARWASGMVSSFDACFHDIIPNARIVYSYVMHLDDRKISVSLATVEFERDGVGTRLTVTEQGAFLDGYDDAGSREHGTNLLMDLVGDALAKEDALSAGLTPPADKTPSPCH